jgi:hypothetical protein
MFLDFNGPFLSTLSIVYPCRATQAICVWCVDCLLVPSFSVADDDGGTVAACRLRLGEGQEDRLVATRRDGMNTRTSVVSE